ncbi:MAG: DHH family phosphoesterase, partial [Planctomycetota bacterium]
MSTDPNHNTPTDAQQRAVDCIRQAERIILSGHVRPDGDCIGAEAALALGLEKLGKEVWILNPDPPEPQFDYLTERSTYRSYRAGADLPAHDLSILLDASELSRCGDLGEKLRAAPSKKLVIDHHVHSGDDWWDEAFVDVTASATGLLVRRVLRAL